MEHDYPTTLADIEPRHVEDWMASILETNKPAKAVQSGLLVALRDGQQPVYQVASDQPSSVAA